MNWDRDGRSWPHRDFSRFVTAGGLRWHVQVMGEGPAILLLHGTGASTHSFRALVPLLAREHTVVVPDLPGHGFTGTPRSGAGFTLPAVAAGVTALLQALQIEPVLAAGHSAGAAIAIRMALDGAITPDVIVSLNGALLPFPGPANSLFGSIARSFASSSLTAFVFSTFAGVGPSVDRMLRATGSHLGAEGARFYARLAGDAGHVHGALALMANWDLRVLLRDLPRLRAHLILLVGGRDGMVPPAQARRIRTVLPSAEIVTLPELGHLAHEERPEAMASLVERALNQPATGP